MVCKIYELALDRKLAEVVHKVPPAVAGRRQQMPQRRQESINDVTFKFNQWLAMDQKRLQMEAEKKEKEEDEHILAINLDQCQPMQRMYYEALQENILEKMMARRRGPSQ